jgi:DNA mismatch repair protein MutS2
MKDRVLRVLEYTKIMEMLTAYASAEQTKRRIREHRPMSNKALIEEALHVTTEVQSLLIQTGSFHFGPIKSIEHALKMAEIGSSLMPRQLLEICDTLRTMRLCKTFILNNNRENKVFPILTHLAQSISPQKNLEDAIETAIISDEEISDNASPTLRSIRRQIEAKHASIRSKMESMIASREMQKFLQDSIITIRQDRFVIPVKAEHKSHVPGLVHDQSSSGATFYIEPMAIVQLNNELKELHLKEKEEIEKILLELSQLVGEKASQLRLSLQAILELDFNFAKGRFSLMYNGIQPALNAEGIIRIKRGRHPLIPKNQVVPSTLWLGESFGALLITGPNTGGKTVTLKTVGLLCLMNQAGLLIPADEGTTLPVFQQIFADIGDEQSIEQSLSTFSSHMTNIVSILKEVDSESLVLLDELGAGTDPTEGAALAIALLKELEIHQTRVVATTHYSELKQFALSNAYYENASVEFNIETLSPTYRVLIGIPGKSNAFEISKKLGLSDQVLDRARHFITHDSIAFEDVLKQIEDNKKASEEELNQAFRLKLEADQLKKSYDRKLDKLESQKEKALAEAKREAKALLLASKKESDDILKELKHVQNLLPKEINQKIESLRNQLRQQIQELDKPEPLLDTYDGDPLKTATPGQRVMVLSLGQEAIIMDKENNRGEVAVQVGILKMNVPLKELRTVESKQEEKLKEKYSPKESMSKAMTMSMEIDVRGMNVDEASMEVDKYIDNAYLSNLKEVYIIHGKGTGLLRQGLKAYLKKHPHVKSMRDGQYGEGGIGVTVVELR